jgi:adhesin transport system membrane fusion protein
MSRKFTQNDYEFMSNLYAAVSEQGSKRSKVIIYFWLVTVLLFIIWASLTEIDEITRGNGEVVPSGKNQIVQNLEGGIVKEIYVRIGDSVKKGEPLLKIDNTKSETQRSAIQIKAFELKAKMLRLQAEAAGKPFTVSESIQKTIPVLIENERELYESRQKQYLAGIRVLEDQKKQRLEELTETKEKVTFLEKSEKLIDKEVEMMRPMVDQGVKSKVTFMQLQREQNQIKQELQSTKMAIPRLEAAMSEISNKIVEAQSDFRNKAKQELNEVTAEAMRTQENFDALDDQIGRTLVKSPVYGVIQELYINTVGGVIKPGDDLVEIVPADEESLWIEAKIKPSDIAFLYPGQKAIVKVSAYDFAIYGSLEGKVVHISADTTQDKRENTFYTVHIKTLRNYLGSEKKPLKIIPGMTVSVDIMTGKKTLMDYILKPILKAKQYTFTER